jgi:hypothetical protein
MAFIKDAQATGEAFSSQKKTSCTSKHKIFYFLGHFGLLDPDPDPATQINADPYPKP